MNLKIVRIALNIAIAIFVDQTRADKKCYKPSTPAQLQAAIDETQEPGTFVDGVPNILLLCAGTEVKFKKGDPTINYNKITDGGNRPSNFVMRCESYGMSHGAPCIIDGGGEFEEGDTDEALGLYKPADNSDRRLYIGNAGFLSFDSASNENYFFEGLVIKSFAVTGVGGAFILSGDGNFFFNKCIFTGNQAKGLFGGAVIYVGAAGEGSITFEECSFNLNIALQGSGGAISGFTGFMNFRSCLFKENIAQYGGAISYFGQDSSASRLEMIKVAFGNNLAEEGGGMYFGRTLFKVFDVDFKDNDAATYGDAYVQFAESDTIGEKIDTHKDTYRTILNTGASVVIL